MAKQGWQKHARVDIRGSARHDRQNRPDRSTEQEREAGYAEQTVSAAVSWKDPSLTRDAYVPQARLMVIPSSWPMTPMACRSKDSALPIHRPPASHYCSCIFGCMLAASPHHRWWALVVMMQVVVEAQIVAVAMISGSMHFPASLPPTTVMMSSLMSSRTHSSVSVPWIRSLFPGSWLSWLSSYGQIACGPVFQPRERRGPKDHRTR